jgi:tetratricopeptide (TPR) repeat protein
MCPRLMSARSRSTAKPYRWVEVQHEDLDFYSVPRPFPWPREAELRVEAEKDFPFRTLVEGIQLLLADEEAPPNPVWRRLAAIVDAGEELAEAFEAADLDRAERILDRLGRLHPGCPFVYFNKAFIFRQRGDLKHALGLYHAAVDAAPNLEFLWMRFGELAEEMGRNRQAVSAYRKAQALLAPHPQALEGLARLGAMKRVEHLTEEGQREVVYVTAEEFEEIIHTEIDGLTNDRPKLQALLDQLLLGSDGALAVAAAQRLLALDPEDAAALRSLGEAWRLAGNSREAEVCLAKALARSPTDAWAHHLMAWVRFDQGDSSAGWGFIDRALDLDPNLQAAILCKFGLKPGQDDPAREQRVAAWAAERRSYQGFLLASIQARDREDEPTALEYARQAFEIAPDNKMVLLQYTGLLGQTGEKEWMAALTKRMLVAGQGDYQVKYQFANALNDLGLADEATKILRDTLAEEPDIPLDWQDAFVGRIDRWSGRLAESEVPLERFGDGILRRPVMLQEPHEGGREMIPAGAPLPQSRTIKLSLDAPASSVSLSFEQGQARGELGPSRLGCFRVDGIDVSRLPDQPPAVRLTATGEGVLQVSARQGGRKLPITWSLYRAPEVE